MKLHRTKIIPIGIALIAGLVAGSLSFGFIPVIADESSQNHAKVPVIKVNENGQKYGSRMGVTSSEQEPDLILAKGVDGTVGYIKKEDLNREEPKTPEEAIALQNKKMKEGPKKIPLYDADGETIIGEFKINSQNGHEFTSQEQSSLNK